MTQRRRNGILDEEAAAWAVRVDQRDLDVDPCAELDAWLAGDPRRAGALLRAQAVLNLIDDGQGQGGEADPEPGIGRSLQNRRRLLAMTAGGGALIAAGIVGAVMSRPPVNRYATGLGEIRQVPLADGSRASINTESVLTVALGRRLREVVLERGEAWFQVAHDPSRPFVVKTAAVQVRALGTAFSVRQSAGGAEVIVTEGLVEAKTPGGEPLQLPVGVRLRASADGAIHSDVRPEDLARALAWRNGEILLDGQTVEEAALQFNRYNQKHISVDDAGLARERFVGLFRTNDPVGFASAVAASLDAMVIETASAIHLQRPAPSR